MGSSTVTPTRSPIFIQFLDQDLRSANGWRRRPEEQHQEVEHHLVVYLNSKKTVAEGRRIAAGKACPDPTCIEIADCCSYLKIPHAIELDKTYPRDFFQVGRVRVQLKKDDGSLVNPAIKTSAELLI
ncbi:signal recognition particle 19 kDa protein-like [Phragmites australis]|uniref:signal recognition particle 19 kDa protein-like n=1 Tax=Phragmites australis TaxID=29695 RepID=UPI002D7A0221|nr:signal recognition particle 19 kDa protein-like [Phragmites australis]